MNEANKLQSEMMDAIKDGGAWFSARRDIFIKIGYSEAYGCYFARECRLKDNDMDCYAYSFGTDWFDISFHGKYIDIYADSDTFKTWEIWYEKEKGTAFNSSYKSIDIARHIIEFCETADKEALEGITNSYEISGTNFDFLASQNK